LVWSLLGDVDHYAEPFAGSLCCSTGRIPVTGRIILAGRQRRARPSNAGADGTVLRLSTDELVRLAPRLRGYLATPAPSWPDVVDAADWLRGELGVSKPLWGEACLAMGREEAAIAVAIVSAKPADHFRSSPGGYFHGMVAKGKAGERNTTIPWPGGPASGFA
jgi:replication initiation protein RepC